MKERSFVCLSLSARLNALPHFSLLARQSLSLPYLPSLNRGPACLLLLLRAFKGEGRWTSRYRNKRARVSVDPYFILGNSLSINNYYEKICLLPPKFVRSFNPLRCVSFWAVVG